MALISVATRLATDIQLGEAMEIFDFIAGDTRNENNKSEESQSEASSIKSVRACGHSTFKRDKLVAFKFLGTGAANVVFRIRTYAPGPDAVNDCFRFVDISEGGKTIRSVPPQELAGQVLRVPRGHPKHLTGQEILAGLEDIRSLFAPIGFLDTVVRMTGGMGISGGKYVKYPVPKEEKYTLVMTKHLDGHQGEGVFLTNKVINSLRRKLPESVDFYQTGGRLALLLPDLGYIPNKTLSLEVKPKWLLQSRNAPEDAKRCRTCAMQHTHMDCRNCAMQDTHMKKRAEYICPLRLVRGENDDIKLWIQRRIKDLYSAEDIETENLPPEADVVSTALEFCTGKGDGATLLSFLRWLQGQLDLQGVLKPVTQDDVLELWKHNLRCAMTLRDCSVFINIPYTGGSLVGPITAKLGDLDLKSAVKIPDWAEKEQLLLKKGHYMASRGSSPMDDDPVRSCLLLD